MAHVPALPRARITDTAREPHLNSRCLACTVPAVARLGAARGSRWIVYLLALALVLVATSAPAGERSLNWQGLERQYLVRNIQPDPAPIVVLLHGLRREKQALALREDLSPLAWDQMEPHAGAEGVVTVYPLSWTGTWNMFPGATAAAHPDGGLTDDVGFIFAMVRQLVAEGIADPARVYVGGFSNGAILTYRLICTEGNPFAAAVPFVGTMHESLVDGCADIPPTPIFVIAGTNDRILPWDGWIFSSGREISVPEVMEYWRLRHGCSGQRWKKLTDWDEEDDSRIVRVWWTGCARDFAVELWRVEGGGHTAPHPEPVSESWRERAGGHNRDADSAAAALRFMLRFARE